MENENILFGDLLYERADDVSVFSDFYCGISVYYDTIEIEYLAVRQSKQKQGIGKGIINLIAEKMMHGRNMLSVSAYIDVDTGYTAEPFYKECGFRRIGRPLHALADNVRMIRFL